MTDLKPGDRIHPFHNPRTVETVTEVGESRITTRFDYRWRGRDESKVFVRTLDEVVRYYEKEED